MVKKGSWVSVQCTVLDVGQRAPQVPDDTKKVPLIMWTKGYLTADAAIGDTVEIITRVGRKQTGTLIEVNPTFNHGFGNFIPELNKIGEQLRSLLFTEDN